MRALLLSALMALTLHPVTRVTLIPASRVVNTSTCRIVAHQAHVRFSLRATESPTFFQVLAHTTTSSFLWRAHRKPGPGWARVTRRLAIATVNCGA